MLVIVGYFTLDASFVTKGGRYMCFRLIVVIYTLLYHSIVQYFINILKVIFHLSLQISLFFLFFGNIQAQFLIN